jgi:DNA-binding response OmpR family regulator
MTTLRTQDIQLANLLYEQLDGYIIKSIPKDKLEYTVQKLILEIRKNSRTRTDSIKLDEDFYWNSFEKKLLYKEKEILLTNKERALLSLLFSKVKRNFTYETIYTQIWGSAYPSRQDSLKTLVKTLRKKLPKNIIKNIFGFGYRIDL